MQSWKKRGETKEREEIDIKPRYNRFRLSPSPSSLYIFLKDIIQERWKENILMASRSNQVQTCSCKRRLAVSTLEYFDQWQLTGTAARARVSVYGWEGWRWAIVVRHRPTVNSNQKSKFRKGFYKSSLQGKQFWKSICEALSGLFYPSNQRIVASLNRKLVTKKVRKLSNVTWTEITTVMNEMKEN